MSAKFKITIESGRRLPDGTRPEHGMTVAWAEANGIPVTGPLSAHSNREVAEQQAVQELARRLRRALADDDEG
jgi:hypothetical protein